MKSVYITSGVRTPIGKMGGSLKDIDPLDLGSMVVEELLRRSNQNKENVDQIVFGSVRQSAAIPNLAKRISDTIGLNAPGYTVHRQCGSGLQAIMDSYEIIGNGECDVIIAGGAENMSQSNYFIRGGKNGLGNGDVTIEDALVGGGPGAIPKSKYGYNVMGETAEKLADKYSISRLEQDEFAQESQERMARAQENGFFDTQIMPIKVGDKVFAKDEHPFLSNLEKLSTLRPVFRKEGTVTAGNASGRNDGAAAVLIVSEDKLVGSKGKEVFKIISSGTSGCDPTIMGIGPVESTNKALKNAGLTLDEIDVIELNEAFAAQSLAVVSEWEKISTKKDLRDRINPNGGAIAHGHPLAATGTMLTIKCMNELLSSKDKKYGLITLCCAGGLGVSMIIEKVTI